jgi:hypothetical protein
MINFEGMDEVEPFLMKQNTRETHSKHTQEVNTKSDEITSMEKFTSKEKIQNISSREGPFHQKQQKAVPTSRDTRIFL